MKRAEIRGYVILLGGAGLAATCGFMLGIPEISYYGKYVLPGVYQFLVAGIPIGMLVMVWGLWLAAQSEERAD